MCDTGEYAYIICISLLTCLLLLSYSSNTLSSFSFSPAPAAQQIFLCSLWLLPVLLAGFVLHNKQWDQQHQQLALTQHLGQGQDRQIAEGEEGEGVEGLEESGPVPVSDALSGALLRAKDALRGVCVHEVIATNNANNASNDANASNSSSAPSGSGSGGQSDAAPAPATHLCAKVAVATGLQAGVGAAKSKGKEAAAAAAGLAGKGDEVQG